MSESTSYHEEKLAVREVWTWRHLPQERRRTPENRRLTVEVAGVALSFKIVIEIVLPTRALAHIRDVCLCIKAADQCKPSSARRLSIHSFVEPAVFDTGDHREREHSSA